MSKTKKMPIPICPKCKHEVKAMAENGAIINHAIWPDGTGYHVGTCPAKEEKETV